MKRLIGASVFALVLWFSSICTQQPKLEITKRSDNNTSKQLTALVIGNSAYAIGPLKNPANDARDMAQALRELGFEVIHKENLNQNDMKRAIRTFGERLRNGGVGLFYYAGHGVQVKGQNYLVPVDAKINSEEEIEYECVDTGLVLAQMESAGNRMNIMVLDACRNNPFARSFRSGARGLATINAPSGTLIAYATAPGSVASDGSTQNGLYTQELLKNMRTPNLSIEQVFKRVRISVLDLTQGKQTPWESSSLVGDFYFARANASLAEPNTTPANRPDNLVAPLPVIKPDPTDPISGEWEIKAIAWKTKDGKLLPRNPDTSIVKLTLEGNQITGTGSDVTGIVVNLRQGRWENNQLSFTFDDPSIKVPVSITGHFQGNKLVGETRVANTLNRTFKIPYGGQQYDLRDLVVIWEGTRKR